MQSEAQLVPFSFSCRGAGLPPARPRSVPQRVRDGTSDLERELFHSSSHTLCSHRPLGKLISEPLMPFCKKNVIGTLA